MNYLLFFQYCLNFGNLCIYREVSSTLKVVVAAVCFCLIEIKCFANILSQGHYFSKYYFNFICCSIHSNNLKNFHFC